MALLQDLKYSLRAAWRDRIPGISEVAVISDGIWKRRFGSDPRVVGKRIRISSEEGRLRLVAPATFVVDEPRLAVESAAVARE